MLDKITNYMQTISGSNTCNWDPVRLYIWVGKLMYKFNLFRELINILEYILTKYNFLLIDFDNMLLWLNLKSTKRLYGTNKDNETFPKILQFNPNICIPLINVQDNYYYHLKLLEENNNNKRVIVNAVLDTPPPKRTRTEPRRILDNDDDNNNK